MTMNRSFPAPQWDNSRDYDRDHDQTVVDEDYDGEPAATDPWDLADDARDNRLSDDYYDDLTDMTEDL